MPILLFLGWWVPAQSFACGGGELRQKVSGCPVFFPLMGRNFTIYKKKPQNEGGVLISTTEVVHFSATSSSFSGRFFGAPLRPPQTSKRLLFQNQEYIYIYIVYVAYTRIYVCTTAQRSTVHIQYTIWNTHVYEAHKPTHTHTNTGIPNFCLSLL